MKIYSLIIGASILSCSCKDTNKKVENKVNSTTHCETNSNRAQAILAASKNSGNSDEFFGVEKLDLNIANKYSDMVLIPEGNMRWEQVMTNGLFQRKPKA